MVEKFKSNNETNCFLTDEATSQAILLTKEQKSCKKLICNQSLKSESNTNVIFYDKFKRTAA